MNKTINVRCKCLDCDNKLPGMPGPDHPCYKCKPFGTALGFTPKVVAGANLPEKLDPKRGG